MGKYLKDADRRLEKIKYFFDHAGPFGYAQAKPHFESIGNLMLAAHRNRKYQNEAPLIKNLLDMAKPMMDQMKERASSND